MTSIIPANKVHRLESGVQFHQPKPAISRLEEVPAHTDLVLRCLEPREICRVATCSRALKEQAKAPRLWQTVSSTFLLPDSFWKERSKGEVQQNLALLKRVNSTFIYCCRLTSTAGLDGETLRQKVIKFSKQKYPNLLLRPETSIERFRGQTHRMVQAMCRTDEPSAALHEMLMCDAAAAARILEMFYACGERGTAKTLNYISGAALYFPKMRDGTSLPGVAQAPAQLRNYCFAHPTAIHQSRNHDTLCRLALASDATLSQEALELILKYGELPESCMPLLIEYHIRPSARLAQIIHDLIERKRVPANFRLDEFTGLGPLEYIRFCIESASLQVDPRDLTIFLIRLSTNIRRGHLPEKCAIPFGIQEVIDLIDLMLAKNGEARQVAINQFADLPGTFEEIAYFFSRETVDQLMQLSERLISLGIKPISDPTSPHNSVRVSLLGKCSCEFIAFLVKQCKVLPPYNVQNLINENYSDEPQVQEQLLKLFSSQT